jgi:indolepyruvate ferredoxin oxidoreductase
MAMPPQARTDSQHLSTTFEEMIERRVGYLTDYQDAAYARRYRELVARVQAAEGEQFAGKRALSAAVARYAFKLMAYKDEYEVARLHTQTGFVERIAEQFEGDYKLVFHLAPPILSQLDPVSGEPKKKSFGPWMLTAFRLLAKLKGLRGGALDVFGYSAERKMERQLIADYFALVDALLAGVTAANYDTAIDLAAIPEHIRGFGHVKLAHLHDAKQRQAELLAKFNHPQPGNREIRIRQAA